MASLVTWAAVSDFDRWTQETKRTWREDGVVQILNQRTGQHMPLEVSLLDDFEANRTRLDIRAAAARIAVPWLIVHGTDDLTVKASEAHALQAASRGARLRLIEGAGHTFEARHPFERSTPQLDVALEETVRHLRAALDR